MVDLSIFVTAIILGINGAMIPGPLMALIISETLQHGKKEGMKVAIIPFVTDLPIIFLAIFFLSNLSNMFIGGLSLLGGLFLGYMAIQNIVYKKVEISIKKVKPQSFKKAIITQYLNPNMYIFWITIGVPIILGTKSFLLGFLFVVLELGTFVISNFIFIHFINKSRSLLKSKYFVYTIRFLGLFLMVFSIKLLIKGISLV
ncbi:LysE family transporter [archaeon]|jgi:threonine/homoserine/homoserine lactone efflux protein|nr:LysE family transporter [archaeon]MBT4648532.1 LysE family transporter [archaeon]MBT6821351.1 LysE family transporter [archaeon]MBT7391966.1 LysE family transporter [archaeon]